jgi:hypothetical protein
MASEKIMQAVADKLFCQRVAFVAMQVAARSTGEPPETPNYANRVAYANMVFRGDERALLLAVHVVSASSDIGAALEAGSEVTDEQLALALEAIWDTRATAFGSVNNELVRSYQAINEARLQVAGLHEAVEATRMAIDAVTKKVT